MTEIGPRTGEFHLRVEVGPDASDEVRADGQLRLLNDMMHHVAAALDGRRYVLAANFGAWEPGAPWPFGESLQVDFSLVLSDALTAEVGEWVADLGRAMPDDAGTTIRPIGVNEERWHFRPGRLGWQRIE